MLVECTLKRRHEGPNNTVTHGTTIDFAGKSFTFSPDPETGKHVAEMNESDANALMERVPGVYVRADAPNSSDPATKPVVASQASQVPPIPDDLDTMTKDQLCQVIEKEQVIVDKSLPKAALIEAIRFKRTEARGNGETKMPASSTANAGAGPTAGA